MLNAEQIQKLKQSNISVHSGKTIDRVKDTWKTASGQQKDEIKQLAGVVAQTFYRVYKTGSVSAKLVVALAQSLNANPFFFTGEADEPGEYTDALLRELLLKHKYNKLLAEFEIAEVKPKRAYTRRQQPAEEVAIEEETEEIPEATEAVEAEPEAEVATELPTPLQESYTLDESDLRLLLNALIVKSTAGVPSAKEKLEQVQRLLLA